MGRSEAPLATNHQNHHITKFLAFLIAISTKPLPKDVSAKIDQICPILVPSSLVVFFRKVLQIQPWLKDWKFKQDEKNEEKKHAYFQQPLAQNKSKTQNCDHNCLKYLTKNL